MTRGAAMAGALVFAATAWSQPAAAWQGHETKAAAQHAKPATADPHAAKPPAPATAPASAAKSQPAKGDLKSALARIDQQIKEVVNTPAPVKPAAARAPAAAPLRIKLQWRLHLTWPAELSPL
jgi:hypothetical protein